jgi:hypothetical protein
MLQRVGEALFAHVAHPADLFRPPGVFLGNWEKDLGLDATAQAFFCQSNRSSSIRESFLKRLQ